MVLEHVEKRLEHSRGKRDRCSIQPPQEPFSSVEVKRAEFVDVTGSSLHRSFQTIQKKFSRGLKTFIEAPSYSTRRKFDSDLACAQRNKNPQKQ